MLQNLRDYFPKWFTFGLLGLFGMLIAGTGLNIYSEHTSRTLAKVNRTNITYQRLERQYELFKLNSESNETIVPDLEQAIRIQLLEQLISTEALQQAARHNKYRIPSNEALGWLKNMPELQVDGVFSKNRLKELLMKNAYTLTALLKEMENRLLLRQLAEAITSTAFILPLELQTQTQLLEQTRDFSYLTIKPESFVPKDSMLNEEVIKSYYYKHIDAFHTPEQASIEYLVLDDSEVRTSQAASQSVQKESSLQPFNQRAQQLIRLGRTQTLEDTAQALGLEIETSSLITLKEGKDEITQHPRVRQVIFDTQSLKSKKNIFVPISASKVVLLRVKEYHPLQLLPFEVVQEQVIELYKKEVAQQKARAYGKQVVAQLTQGCLPEIGSGTWQVVKDSNRYNPNVSKLINESIFEMPPHHSSPSIRAIEGANGEYIILKLEGVHAGPLKKDDQASRMQEEQSQEIGRLDYLQYVQTCIKSVTIRYFL